MELDQTRSRAEHSQPGSTGRTYLLVFEGDSSRVVPLGTDQEFFVGRAPECEVRLDDDGASRKHARLTLKAGQVSLSDLSSHNGTRVNGTRITGDVMLSAGDTIAISDSTLVLHCNVRAAPTPAFCPERVFRGRLAAELERSLRFERALCVAHLSFTGKPDLASVELALEPSLGSIGVATWLDGAVVVVLPEVKRADAAPSVEALVEALGANAVSAGFAVFPDDGAQADTLLLAARQAAAKAKPGAMESADQAARRLSLGTQRTVLVADPAMERAFGLLERLAKAALPVLIQGETGVGKENAAFAVHHFSARSKGPFVSLNCAGLPESLLEGELFGYEKGAFSGAVNAKAGLIESSAGGTLFLDELGELSLSAQARLLRVLETKTVMRLGSVKEMTLDLRVVAATHRDLQAEVKAGRFRQDLFFRLNAAVVFLPPLRERPREIALLARAFASAACEASQRASLELSASTIAVLCAYPWPGNVRELKNAMEFAVATAPGAFLDPEHLPAQLGVAPAPLSIKPAETAGPTKFAPLAQEIRELERRRIVEALEASGGVQTRAAEMLGMPRRTFVLRLRELRLESGKA